MRTIEITTTQNVVIQIKLATLFDRIIAFVIDSIIVTISYSILAAILMPIFESMWVIYGLVIVLAMYSLIFETLMRGRTIGKAALGIKTIKNDGSQPEFIDYFRRWAMRWIDIYGTFGGVAMISISTSDKGQRIGDKIADTIVVKKNQLSGYELSNITTITNAKDYTPKYPEVRTIPESTMLTVKRVLTRYKRYPDVDTYSSMILELSKKFEANLEIKRTERSHTAFLRQLLKDYVILTR